MISKINTKNRIEQILKEYNFNRKTSRFHSITDLQLQDFPILLENDLYLIASGHYKLNQAKCYYGKHIAPDGKFTTIKLYTAVTYIDFACYELHINNPIFLEARIQWRHVHKTK